jgi:hypothetical protein
VKKKIIFYFSRRQLTSIDVKLQLNSFHIINESENRRLRLKHKKNLEKSKEISLRAQFLTKKIKLAKIGKIEYYNQKNA